MLIIAILVTTVTVVALQKTSVDSSSGFFSHGEVKKLKDSAARLENSVLKSKVEVLGEVFKKHFDSLVASEKLHKVELVFLIDASSSVGLDNFNSELQFVKKLLADFTVSFNQTRVAIVTFSSIGQVVREVDLLSEPNEELDKCSILHHNVSYTGGGTYTLGAMLEAQNILSHSRPNSKKVLFLITDGFSNGGDPRNVAKALKSDGVTVFTFGVHNGNTAELFDMASTPGEEHSFILDSFDEFVALARRALHRDLASGVYVPVVNNGLCQSVCSSVARCACGLRSGQYHCLCPPGHYGLGTADQDAPCLPCPNGTYHDGSVPGDVTMCTPCPDVNHMTLGPATGPRDCVCKRGFVANGSTCEMVRCPELKAPKYGMFVRGSCGSVVNAGCGLRCRVGYSLLGSSVRLCQQDGKWSGKPPKCVVKRCPRLRPPNNGVLVCTPKTELNEDFPVDAECRFSCHNGSHLVGSPVRTCLPLARWDGLPTTCKPIKCLALPEVPNGKWQPEECVTNRKLPFGQSCKMICNPGFVREGPEIRECGYRGWSHKKDVSKCVDTTPPYLECPGNVTVTTNPGAGFASVSWPIPQTHDNSKQAVLLWSDPPSEFPVKLPIGVTYISFVATDSSYNQAICEFSFTVIDKEPPSVEDCESPPVFYVTANLTNDQFWIEPKFSDNSMEKLFINSSHNLNELPMGTTEIMFTAFDSSGNSNMCILNYTLISDSCKDLPPHVVANCSQKVCILSCEEGFAFLTSNLTVEIGLPYSCENSTIPECSETEEPNSIIQEGTISLMSVEKELCKDLNFLNQIKTSVQSSFSESCLNDSNDCNVHFEAKCEEVVSFIEEQSNQVITRKKRSVPHKNVNINFKITAKYDGTSNQDKLSSIMNNSNSFSSIFKQKNSHLIIKPSSLVCPEGSVSKRNHCVKCPAGMYWKNDTLDCFPCGFGTYQPLSSQDHCLPCPDNSSTRKIRAKHIHSCREICPAGTYGSSRGLHGVGRLGVRPCLWCPVGWYQSQVGALACVRCDGNMTTTHRRSTHPQDCYADPSPCSTSTQLSCSNGGTCLVEGNYTTCICPSGYFGSRCEMKKDDCQSMPCLHGGSCLNTEGGYVCSCADGYSGLICEIDIDDCASNPCKHGGECMDLIASFTCLCPASFQGDTCEEDVNDCLAEPCADGSTCIDLVGNYSCVCRLGYRGRHCEQDPCLDTTLCGANGACHLHDTNNVTDSYWCECDHGYTGIHCKTEVDLCLSSPCQNNATCISQTFTSSVECLCRPGYGGKHCDTYFQSNFTIFFPTSGTSNYVKLKGFHSSIDEVTLCLWMRTQDQQNYGTVFSYATRAHDNTLTLTDYNGFVLYVNNDRVVSDVTANDGVWHHICIEWASYNGQWTFYKDGILEDGGSGLANNTLISGGGIFVLGQDQDQIGGGFNAAESLVGYLTQLNIWNSNVGADKINNLATLCGEQEEGNVMTWGQFREGIQGKVEISPSPLCQGCSKLDPPQFTSLDFSQSGNIAVYKCNPGYSIKNYRHPSEEVSSVERRCLVHGEWEGVSPICTRKSCGFPGFFASGWIVGQSYLYESQIEYFCKPGYRLVGDRIRMCMENETWSGRVPSCQGGGCPDVFVPEDGMMWGSYEEDFKLEFECKAGFQLYGSEIIHCLQNKTWSHDAPKCSPVTCKYASNSTAAVLVAGPEHLTEGFYHVSSTIQVNCLKGYKSDQEPYIMRCTTSGWHPPPHNLGCHLIFCSEPHVSNGSATSNSLTTGSIVKITCDKGFSLEGLSEHICLENGEWSSTSRCEKITCPEMSTVHLVLPESELGKVATIQCPPGMVLLSGGIPVKEQEIRWECGEDGRWTNLTEAPVNPLILDCVSKSPAACSIPAGPQFGYIVPNSQRAISFQEGQMLQIQCRQGYELEGSSFTVCRRDGSWTKNTSCRAVDCGPPPSVALTQLTALSSTLYGSTVRLECEQGYKAYGDTLLHCLADGRWSRLRGRCVRISCGKPTLNDGLIVVGNAYLYQEKLKIQCPSGYNLDGKDFITCEKDGKWSPASKCVKI